MRALRILAVVAGLLAAAAGPAAAATVEVHPVYYKPIHEGDEVRYRAGPGERNRPVITLEGDSIVITDDVGLVPGSGCASEPGGAVRCAVTPNLPRHVRVWLADRNDRVRIASLLGATLHGGSGNDRLVGAADAAAYFDGGPGNDRMLGGHSTDRFFEGSKANGADTMISLSGGIDALDYGQRRHGVRASLDGRRNDGEAGERDLIGPQVHEVWAGDGDDVLVGGPEKDDLQGNGGRDRISGKAGDDTLEGDSLVIELRRTADRIYGGPGDDIMKGGSGPDFFVGGPGEDSVMAGPGNDGVDSNDGEMDFVGCGDGKKDWVDKDDRDLLNPDCESTRRLEPDGDTGRAHALLGLAHAVLAVVEDRRA